MIISGNEPTAMVEKNLVCVSDSKKFIEAILDQNFEMLEEFPKNPMDIMMDSMSDIKSSERISNIMLTVDESIMTVTFLRDSKLIHIRDQEVHYHCLPVTEAINQVQVDIDHGDILVLASP